MAAPDVELLWEEEQVTELHPGLAPLRGVGARTDGELRKAWAGLALARGQWLRWEGLWAGLQELLRQDPPSFRAVERALTLAQVRQGNPLMTSLPPPQDPAPLRRLLLPALQLHLAHKAASLADYHGGGASGPLPPEGVASGPLPPEGGDSGPLPPGGGASGPLPPGGVASAPLPPEGGDSGPLPPEGGASGPLPPGGGASGPLPPGGVAQALANETRRLGHARRRGHALRELLSRQRRLLPEVLGRIAALLGRLAGQAAAWAERDRRRGRYLEAQGAALLLKIRLEELRVLLDTYPPGLVEAHRSIRSLLLSEAAAASAESSGLRGALSAFRALGPGFESRARHYGRLRQRLRHRRWALRQLRPHGPAPHE